MSFSFYFWFLKILKLLFISFAGDFLDLQVLRDIESSKQAKQDIWKNKDVRVAFDKMLATVEARQKLVDAEINQMTEKNKTK